MAVRLSGKNDVLRRPSLRVLSGGGGDPENPVEAGGPVPETIDPIGKSLDQLDSSLPQLAPVLTGRKPDQGRPSGAPSDSVLWSELHQLLARLEPAAAPAKAQPSPKPPAQAPAKPSPAPIKSSPKPPAPKANPTYTVQPGDSLSAIAQKTLGDANRWPEIFALNRGVIGANPNVIHPGQVLRLPVDGSAPAPSPAPSGNSSEPWSPGAGALNGADSSSWQSEAAFEQSIQGEQWTAIKAAQGTGYTDPTFQSRWNLLGQKVASGSMKLRVAYDFLDPGDGATQAKHFLDVVGIHGKLPAGTRLALDWEGPALNDPGTLRNAANYIHQVTGTWPLIYVSASQMSAAQKAVPQAPIWEAAWGPAPDRNVPFVQFSDGPTYDHDVFNGSTAALDKFAGWA